MEVDCLYKQFIKIEDKYDFFSVTLNGINIWQFMRTYVAREVIEDISGLLLLESNRKAVIIKNKKSFINSLRTNPYLVHKKDLLIVGLSRRVYDGKYYTDSYTDEIIKHLEYSFYLYEDSYMGGHFEPVRVKNIKYNDKYISIGKKLNITDVSRSAKKWLDYIIKILENEFDINLSSKRKRRLFAILISLLTTYNHSYRNYCEYILDVIKPKAVIVVCSPIISNMILIQEAKKRKIPTIELAHGMMDDYNPAYNTLKKRNMEIYPDYIFTFGEYDREIANYPINKQNVIPVGYAELEKNLKRNKKAKSVRKIQITFLDGGSTALCKYVCYLSKVLDLSKYNIILKLHPMQYNTWKEQYSELIDIPVKVVDNNMHDVHYYIDQSDYIIGIATTALYEATLYPCHIGIIAEENYIFSKPLYEKKQALLIRGKEELVDFVTGKTAFVPREANFFKKNAIGNFNKELNKIILDRKKG